MTAALFFMGARTRAASNFVLWLSEKDLGGARQGDFMYTSEARTEYGIFLSDREKSWTTHAHRGLIAASSQFFRPCFAFVFVWPPRASTKERKRER